jgi:hypothetical protein
MPGRHRAGGATAHDRQREGEEIGGHLRIVENPQISQISQIGETANLRNLRNLRMLSLES